MCIFGVRARSYIFKNDSTKTMHDEYKWILNRRELVRFAGSRVHMCLLRCQCLSRAQHSSHGRAAKRCFGCSPGRDRPQHLHRTHTSRWPRLARPRRGNPAARRRRAQHALLMLASCQTRLKTCTASGGRMNSGARPSCRRHLRLHG